MWTARAESATRCSLFAFMREAGIVQTIERAGDATKSSDQFGTARFRRVRSQHRLHGQAGQVRSHRSFTQPSTQLLDRLFDRLGEDVGSSLFSKDALTMLLLGKVGEVEITSERACNELGPLGFPTRDEGLALRSDAWVVPRRDDQAAQLFHCFE